MLEPCQGKFSLSFPLLTYTYCKKWERFCWNRVTPRVIGRYAIGKS